MKIYRGEYKGHTFNRIIQNGIAIDFLNSNHTGHPDQSGSLPCTRITTWVRYDNKVWRKAKNGEADFRAKILKATSLRSIKEIFAMHTTEY